MCKKTIYKVKGSWPCTAMLLFLLCVNSKQAFSQLRKDSIAYASQLLKIEQKLQDGTAVGDTATWNKYLAKNFMIVNEDGSRNNRQEFLSMLKPLPDGSNGHIIVKSPHFNFTADAVILNFIADEYETVLGQNLHTTYGYQSVYQKQKNSWKLINIQVFEIPQLPPAIKVADSILKQYTGTYLMTPNRICHITLVSHQLFLQKEGSSKYPLFPETTSVFFRTADTRGRKIFYKANGSSWEMHERRNGQDLIWIWVRQKTEQN